MVSVECAVTYRSNPVARREWNDVPTIPSYRTGAHPGISPPSCGSGPPSRGRRLASPRREAGDWPHYTADMQGHPLLAARSDQRRRTSSKLEVAWRFKTDNLGPRPEYKLEGTPLAIKGILYTTGGTRRSVVALDGKTGEVIWTHSLREGQARRGLAAAALGTRRVVLDRRQRRRARHLHDDRLSARRAEREDRRDDSDRSARAASST